MSGQQSQRLHQNSLSRHSRRSRTTSWQRLRMLVKLLALLALVPALQACKVQIEVPKGGLVKSESGAYRCAANTSCEIDVVDQFFSETFVAQANPGWMFRHWEEVPGGFCGNKIGPCSLSTAGFENSEDLVAILESDQVFHLKPVFERIPQFKREAIETAGKVVNLRDGMEVDGSVKLTTGKGPARQFEDARLELGFDASGNLEALDGEGILPENLTRKFRLDAAVKADIGYYTGKEINANEEISITLMDKRNYLVFYASSDVSYSFDQHVPGDNMQVKKETEQVTINTPASGKVIMILDPHDEMIYRYGETPLKGASGEAQSDRGLLPYVPIVDAVGPVERFDGHQYKTVTVGVGIKALDVLNLTGEQVTYQPKLFDIDLSDPFNTDIDYRAGFNGSAEVAISVFGFSVQDMFEFDLGKASASFDVSRKRQAMALVAKLEPGELRVPFWVPVKPRSTLAVELTAKGKGAVAMKLAGTYESLIPRANLEAALRITPDALTLSGEVSGPVALPASISFRDNSTHGKVGVTADFKDHIASGVDAGFDRAEQEVTDAIAALEEAIADYEFELSLRGLRQSLPGTADAVTRAVNQIPGIVYDRVYDEVKKGIDDRNKCVRNVCVISKTTRNAKAKAAAEDAEDDARNSIKPYLTAMKELKRSALEDNDETLIDTIRIALRRAYAHRRYRETFRVTVKVAGHTVTKSYTADERLLSNSVASNILTASENVHRIPETSELVISARQVVDHLPTREIIDRARRAVDDGVASVPAVKGVDYTVINDKYSAAVSFGDGSRFAVDFNVLDWTELTEGIADLLAENVMDSLN